MKIKVILAGATGWVGKQLAKEISQSHDMQLVGAIAADHLGQDLGAMIDVPHINVQISSLREGLQVLADVFVDFTSPDTVKHNVISAIQHKMFVVIGTSGLSDKDYVKIDELARHNKLGVIAAGNFSLTAVLMQRFALMAAQYIPTWEIIDYASAEKPDAPSGTARELAYHLSEIRTPHIEISIGQNLGIQESRGATLHGTQIHSVRLPGYTLSNEVIFGMPDEKLIIRHEAGSSPDPYLAGVLLAIRKVQEYTGLVRGLDRIL